MTKRQANTEERSKARKSTRLSLRLDEAHELQRIIVVGAFGRPSATRLSAVDYVLSIRLAQAVRKENMAEYIRSHHPYVKPTTINELWLKLQRYFSAENQENLETQMAPKMAITSMIAAFTGTARCIVDIPSLRLLSAEMQLALPKALKALRQLPQPQQLQESSPTAAGSITGGRNSRHSSSGTSSGSSSNSKLSPSALSHLLMNFTENANKFFGEPWVLSSGTTVDDVLVAWARKTANERLTESELHSFVIADVEDVLIAFENEKDKVEARAVLEARPGDPFQELTHSERAYLELFAKGPREVGELLDNGWKDISLNPPESNPDNDFRKLVYHWMTQLHIVYQKNNYQLPSGESEGWFLNMLWGPMALVLSAEEELHYKHGEYCSASSSLRKAIDREYSQRQAVGRKADGMVLGASTGLEICVLEAAKKDAGPRSIKALHDTLKIGKFTKDMVDVMRAKVPEAVYPQLVAYGLRLAAGSMHLYTLRQRDGRFDQLFYETSVSFPPKWTKITAEEITAVIGQVMILRKELTTYSTNIATWKKGHKPALAVIRPVVPTLSTPVNSPRLLK
ncbi:hypothetical protein EMPS_05402 [Entomortierella parvispora]|uniref:Uncharacterized protein n=1 Tax=Entomortierella parvispora TaxID=205924 RepID=A0A9P3LWG9_9FUNG|nr:hypothetical protein EMPS_05402 [Entomortierella parvispora]